MVAMKLVQPDGSEVEIDHETLLAIQQFVPGQAGKQMNRYLFVIWCVVLGILGLTVFLFGYWAWQETDTKVAAFLMTPATTALGAIAGLLAKSPSN